MLKQRAAGSKFLTVKNGKFYLSSDKELTTPYDELTGFVTDLNYKDEEYNGNPMRKLYITVSSENESYKFGVLSDSMTGTQFVNFLANADLSKEITLSPFEKTENKDGKDVTQRAIFVKQGDKFLKGKYSREELPEVKKVMINKKAAYDKSDLLDFYENVVNEKLKPQLNQESKEVVIKEAKHDWEEIEDGQELPF